MNWQAEELEKTVAGRASACEKEVWRYSRPLLLGVTERCPLS